MKGTHFPRYWTFVRVIHRNSQRPLTRSFDVFFDLRLNKRLSKQSWGWWFETPSRLTIVYSSVHSNADQRKYQSSASPAFVWGIHRWPVNSPHKWPVTRKMFPFDDVIVSSQKTHCNKDSLKPRIEANHYRPLRSEQKGHMLQTIFIRTLLKENVYIFVRV